MDDLQYVQDRLAKTPVSDLEELCERAEVPFGTAHKIKYGQTKNPQYDTVKKLADFFRKEHA